MAADLFSSSSRSATAATPRVLGRLHGRGVTFDGKGRKKSITHSGRSHSHRGHSKSVDLQQAAPSPPPPPPPPPTPSPSHSHTRRSCPRRSFTSHAAPTCRLCLTARPRCALTAFGRPHTLHGSSDSRAATASLGRTVPAPILAYPRGSVYRMRNMWLTVEPACGPSRIYDLLTSWP